MDITHHYIVSYNTEMEEWSIDNDSESLHFPNGTIYNNDTDSWHHDYLGDGEYFPESDELGEKLSVMLTHLNNKG